MQPDAPIRVLHVAPAAPGGGTSGFTARQIDALERRGIESRLVLFSGVALASRPWRLPAAARTVHAAWRDFHPDLVHAHWGSLLAAVSALAIGRGTPLVVTYRGSDINPVPSERRLRSAVRVLASQGAALRADAIICVSDELRRRLWWSGARRRATVVVDGTDLARFHPVERNVARHDLGWSTEERVVLFNANNPRVKRLDLAEAAVAVAARQVGPIRFEVMRGDVPYDRVPMLLNAADCVLMTSDYEGSPNIVREALACGTPVVSVPVGDVACWLDGTPGQRIVDRDPVAIGNALADTITAPFRRTPGAETSAFGEDASADAVAAVYRALARRSGAR